MPLPLTLAVGLCSSAWAVYAIKAGPDYFILAPNVAGVLLCVAQLVLYARYCGNTRKVNLDRQDEALINPIAAAPDM